MKTRLVFQVFYRNFVALKPLKTPSEQKNSMDTKSYVIEEASKLFYENGIKAVRMDDIAVHCSMSKRTIYELFESREKLLEECIDLMMSRLSTLFDNIVSKAQNVLEEFWLVFGASFDKPKVGRLLKELQKLYPELSRKMNERHYHNTLNQNHKKLQIGVEEGLILPQLDLDFFAVTFTNYVFGLPEAEKYVSTDVKTAIIIYMRGMCTEKGREFIDKQLLKIV